MRLFAGRANGMTKGISSALNCVLLIQDGTKQCNPQPLSFLFFIPRVSVQVTPSYSVQKYCYQSELAGKCQTAEVPSVLEGTISK